MNSEITLEINGYRRDILRYNYRFSRNTDLKGRPTTGVLDGSIYIEMESDRDSSILDMMLVDMNKPRPSFFFRAEPVPVSGRIRHTKDEMMLRELVFDEAYISCYGETMNATGNSPMITHFLISPTRLDINRTIRLDRRIKTTYGFWWEEYKEEEVVKDIRIENIPLEFEDSYDEQVQVFNNLGMPISHYLYYIELDGKMIASGRTDEQGLTKRFGNTNSAQNYIIYWGEEALAKIENQ